MISLLSRFRRDFLASSRNAGQTQRSDLASGVVNALLVAGVAGAVLVALYGMAAWGFYVGYVSARVGVTPERELAAAREGAVKMFLCFVGGQLAALALAFPLSARVFPLRGMAIRAGAATGLVVITNLIVFVLLYSL